MKDHAEFGVHLAMQRERFFDADAFSRFYRDNTMSEEIDVLNKDMVGRRGSERCLLIAGVDYLHTAILSGERVGWVFKLLEAVPNRH